MKHYILLLLSCLLFPCCEAFAQRKTGDDSATPLFDILFSENGGVEDAASGMPVYVGQSHPLTYYNPTLARWVAKFSGDSECFYRVDYTDAMESALNGSFSFELYYMANEVFGVAPFSSQQYGGAGIEHIGGKIGFYAHIGGDYRELVANEACEAGVFVHVICTYDREAEELRLYVNGHKEDVAGASGEMRLPLESARWIGIGGDASDDPQWVQSPLNGEIAIARFYNTSVSDERAAELFRQIEVKESVKPEADLVDIVFNTDGTATNRMNNSLVVTSGSKLPAVYYEPRYGMQVAEFDGSSQRYYKIDYSHNEDFKAILRKGFTMETMYASDVVGEQYPFSSQQYGGFGLGQEGNEMKFWVYVGGDYAELTGNTELQAGEVYHVVVTYDHVLGEIRMYVNGKFDGQMNVEGELGFPHETVSQWIGIGCDASAGSDYGQYSLRGTLYLARMYGRAISAEEAALLYDFEDKSVALAPGIYRITNSLTAASLQDGLLLSAHRLSCSVESLDLSQLWEVETEGTNGYLRNMATGMRLSSVRRAAMDEKGTPVCFYQYANGTYAVDCDGLLHTDGLGVTAVGGDENSGSSWRMEPVDESTLTTAAAETNRRLLAWYRPGTRYDEHQPNAQLEAVLAQPVSVEQCRALAKALYVPLQHKLKVLQYNTWNNGTVVSGGVESIKRTIEATNPDILLLQEVRSQSFIDDVINYFREKGVTYYGRSMNSSTAIMSKFPFDSIRSSDELGAGSYAYAKAVVKVDDRELALYSVHLDWKYLGYYYPRGFDGNSDTRPYAAITPYNDAQKVLEDNNKSRRLEEVRVLVQDIQQEMQRNRMIVVAGDFNEPSHLDWQVDTRNMRDHNGLVIDWDCSLMLRQAGMVDAYRRLYPDPVTCPGFTCNAGNKWAEKSDLSWANGVDDRERIDLTYFYPHADMQLTRATIVGPVEDFYDNAVHLEPTADPIFTPEGVWASDHKAVLTEYVLNVNVPMPLNDTRVADGVYYISASPADGEKPVFLTTDAQKNFAFCANGQAPQKWAVEHNALRKEAGESGSHTPVWLNRSGMLQEQEDEGRVFALRAGRTDSVALAFDCADDFHADFLTSLNEITPVSAKTPQEIGERAVFAFDFHHAASGVSDDGTRLSSVVFVDDETASCDCLSAEHVTFVNQFSANTWQAIYFPSPVKCMLSLQNGLVMQLGVDYELARYHIDRNVVEFVGADELQDELSSGAYLLRTKKDNLVQFTFGETAFQTKDAVNGSFTGTNRAAATTVSGYTLNEAGDKFELHEETIVLPFQSYIVCANPEQAKDEIILPAATALQQVDAGNFRITVKNHRIVVSGTEPYKVYDMSGVEVNPHAELASGVYLVCLRANAQTRKVIVR